MQKENYYGKRLFFSPGFFWPRIFSFPQTSHAVNTQAWLTHPQNPFISYKPPSGITSCLGKN
jgi:hypothetical protein